MACGCPTLSSNRCSLPGIGGEAVHNFYPTDIREMSESFRKVCVDSAPLLDKAWAEEAGIGWIGKHSNVINQKIVFYYLMIAVGGDVSNHDDEFDRVIWVNYEEAKKILTYKDEVLILAKGISMVQERRPRSY